MRRDCFLETTPKMRLFQVQGTHTGRTSGEIICRNTKITPKEQSSMESEPKLSGKRTEIHTYFLVCFFIFYQRSVKGPFFIC